MLNNISELLELTKPLMNQSDQVQGPGGNTSFKNHLGEMYIKASGFRFDEMSEEFGISAVKYSNLRNYFYLVEPSDKVKDEADMLQLVTQSILEKNDGTLYPKPSMETGFHAVLDKYVIHTHSVWTNLLNCRKDKTAIINQLTSEFSLVEIPFVSPGFGLSYQVTQAIKKAELEGKRKPEIFLLHSHGVIAHSDNANVCVNLLIQLDATIRSICNVSNLYPDTRLIKKDNYWLPVSDFVNQMFRQYTCSEAFFEQVLFPDQTVFFKNQISFDGTEKKIQINNFTISYHCAQRDARAIHETMTAYLFLYHSLVKAKVEIDFIGRQDIDYINNMDMEKHRKSIL